jgi:uncharacterized protein (TIGR00251 family)
VGARWFRWVDAALELRVQAKTRSRVEGIGDAGDEALLVRVNAPPVEGKANERILLVIAEAFDVPKSRVRLLRGTRARHKWVRIERPGRIPESLKGALGTPSGLTNSEKAAKN